MKVTFLGTPSKNGGCPTAYATDRGTVIAQGSLVTDEEALAEIRKRGLPDHETVIEIPMSLLPYFPRARWRDRVARWFRGAKGDV